MNQFIIHLLLLNDQNQLPEEIKMCTSWWSASNYNNTAASLEQTLNTEQDQTVIYEYLYSTSKDYCFFVCFFLGQKSFCFKDFCIKNSGLSYKLLDLYVDLILKKSTGAFSCSITTWKTAAVYLTWTTSPYWQYRERHRVPVMDGQQLMLHKDFLKKKKKKCDHVNRTNVSTTLMEPFK